MMLSSEIFETTQAVKIDEGLDSQRTVNVTAKIIETCGMRGPEMYEVKIESDDDELTFEDWNMDAETALQAIHELSDLLKQYGL